LKTKQRNKAILLIYMLNTIYLTIYLLLLLAEVLFTLTLIAFLRKTLIVLPNLVLDLREILV